MTQPTLSIITVNFNNNKGLIATLNSIKNQSFTSYEHIIIDACSTDGSKETIIKYSKETSHLAYWVSEKDSGIYDGMNKGIELRCPQPSACGRCPRRSPDVPACRGC